MSENPALDEVWDYSCGSARTSERSPPKLLSPIPELSPLYFNSSLHAYSFSHALEGGKYHLGQGCRNMLSHVEQNVIRIDSTVISDGVLPSEQPTDDDD